jgi:hypothetical protein
MAFILSLRNVSIIISGYENSVIDKRMKSSGKVLYAIFVNYNGPIVQSPVPYRLKVTGRFYKKKNTVLLRSKDVDLPPDLEAFNSFMTMQLRTSSEVPKKITRGATSPSALFTGPGSFDFWPLKWNNILLIYANSHYSPSHIMFETVIILFLTFLLKIFYFELQENIVLMFKN